MSYDLNISSIKVGTIKTGLSVYRRVSRLDVRIAVFHRWYNNIVTRAFFSCTVAISVTVLLITSGL